MSQARNRERASGRRRANWAPADGLGESVRKASLAEADQQTLCSPQISGVRALHEMLKDWLQERTAAHGASLTGEQRRQVHCASQLPCSRGLMAAQIQRLLEAHFCVLTAA